MVTLLPDLASVSDAPCVHLLTNVHPDHIRETDHGRLNAMTRGSVQPPYLIGCALLFLFRPSQLYLQVRDKSSELRKPFKPFLGIHLRFGDKFLKSQGTGLSGGETKIVSDALSCAKQMAKKLLPGRKPIVVLMSDSEGAKKHAKSLITKFSDDLALHVTSAKPAHTDVNRVGKGTWGKTNAFENVWADQMLLAAAYGIVHYCYHTPNGRSTFTDVAAQIGLVPSTHVYHVYPRCGT